MRVAICLDVLTEILTQNFTKNLMQHQYEEFDSTKTDQRPCSCEQLVKVALFLVSMWFQFYSECSAMLTPALRSFYRLRGELKTLDRTVYIIVVFKKKLVVRWEVWNPQCTHISGCFFLTILLSTGDLNECKNRWLYHL